MQEVFGELVPMTCFDVKYLMGGSEKNVRETYIKCCRPEGEARKVVPRDLFTPVQEVSEPAPIVVIVYGFTG